MPRRRFEAWRWFYNESGLTRLWGTARCANLLRWPGLTPANEDRKLTFWPVENRDINARAVRGLSGRDVERFLFVVSAMRENLMELPQDDLDDRTLNE
jgi:hypothetical protein